ncbi:MAG: AAA family ATPase [Candidatus Thorarchaeota archaeon]|nr:AAA family ATPase [Candidatus Thorarchaeota archaeon]
MEPKEVADPASLRGLIHIWGAAGSGKSLLAAYMALAAVSRGRVVWLSLDGKMSVLRRLRSILEHHECAIDSVDVVVTEGHREAYNTVIEMTSRLDESTVLLVIDPITRVLDMSREEDLMWGRELIEDILPALAALTTTRSVTVVVVSEMREVSGRPVAVHYESILRWVDRDLVLRRRPFAHASEVYERTSKDREEMLGHLHLMGSCGLIWEPAQSETLNGRARGIAREVAV